MTRAVNQPSHSAMSGSLILDVARDDPRPRRGCSAQTLKAYLPRSCEVVAIEVHHLGPGPDEVLDKLRLRIRASIDLRQGPELGVRTEDEIDTRGGPLDLARLAIAPFEHVLTVRCPLPLRAHVEQVHEEVVGQRFRPLGKDAE